MRLISSKLFMRGVALLLLFAYSVAAFAQGAEDRRFMSERRIFLWDVTISMVGATNESPNKVPATPRKNPDFDYKGWMYDKDRDIFDATRDELCNLIDQVTNPSCELLVVPYTTDIYAPMMVSTSSQGDKEALKKMVREWNGLKPGGTYTGKCLNAVMNTLFDKSKKNTVVLLTDGRPSTKEDENLLMDLVGRWDWNGVDSRYKNNRLVYVMLNKESELPITPNPTGGVTTLTPGTPVSDLVSFALANTKVKVYINEYVSDGQLASGGVLEIGTYLQDGTSIARAKCGFECAENDYIDVSDDAIYPNENGTFVVPFTFKGPDREYYREVLENGKGTTSMKCVLLTESKEISLVDTDEISVELIVKDEPRAIISLSKK